MVVEAEILTTTVDFLTGFLQFSIKLIYNARPASFLTASLSTVISGVVEAYYFLNFSQRPNDYMHDGYFLKCRVPVSFF